MSLISAGFLLSDAAAIRAEIEAVYTSVYGVNFNLDVTSVNGLSVTVNTTFAIQRDDAQAYIYSSVYNPNVAPAPFIDAICAFNGIVRKSATKSIATCTLSGTPGLLIPVGSQVISTNNDIFATISNATIGVGGTVSAQVEAVVAGVVPVAANSINRIVTVIAGWDSVNNPIAGVEGTGLETDYNLRNRRLQALAFDSTNSVRSIIAGLVNLNDVLDYYIINNQSGASKTERGITVDPYSIYVSVFGGTDPEIAKVMYERYSAGGMNGDTTVAYTDPVYTWVTQDITFQRAVDAPVRIDVILAPNMNYPGNITDLVKASIKDVWDNGFTSTTNQLSPVTMRTAIIYISQFGVAMSENGVYGWTGHLQLVTGGTPAQELTISVDKAPTLSIDDVHVTIGI